MYSIYDYFSYTAVGAFLQILLPNSRMAVDYGLIP